MREHRILHNLGKMAPGWLPEGVQFELKPGEIKVATARVINTALTPVIAVRDIVRGYTDQELANAHNLIEGEHPITDRERKAFVKKKIDILSLTTFQALFNSVGEPVTVFPGTGGTGYKKTVEELQSLTPRKIDEIIREEAKELVERAEKKSKK